MATPLKIARLNSADAEFQSQFQALLAREPASDQGVVETVSEILSAVRKNGDAAVLDYCVKFDRSTAASIAELEVSLAEAAAAFDALAADLREALQAAAERIEKYAQQQKMQSWSFTDEFGSELGQRVTPLDRAGLYVPGGKASYPSTVLMNAIPAKVAGVPEIIMVAPSPGGSINPLVLAAAHVAGVDRIFNLGGAQAVAALAYGTQTIPAVDKIVGPGNAYVAAAKRQVFGKVGIDMIAGPSEILVICDGQTSADWIAMDLFSQAEHDEDAQAILLCPDAEFLDEVAAAMNRLVADLPRQAIIAESIAQRGALIQVRDLQEAAAISNQIAPEHLELSVADPEQLLTSISNAGAVFMGRHTPEAFGDYCAGPNHVLPTAGTARFSSPLGVYDFQKRSSLIKTSEAGAVALAKIAGRLADGEGLQAHAASARMRGE